jgi:hypothetical protein
MGKRFLILVVIHIHPQVIHIVMHIDKFKDCKELTALFRVIHTTYYFY